MSFRWCLPEERKAEEEYLFASASRLSLQKAGVVFNQEAIANYLLPLFESGSVHAGVRDNAIAFALLGGILQPGVGPRHQLPQHSPHWLAFRRLFLALCDGEIPGELLIEAGDLENPFTLQSHLIRKITEIRLASYESVSLAAAKKSLVEDGRMDLDPACGALYEISQNLAWESLPESTELPTPGNEPTALSLLVDVVREAGIDFDIEAEYREAALSVRAVLFDIATEMTVGKVVDPGIDVRELERLFCERRLVEDPYTMISDERILFFGADGMGMNGPDFLNRIASLFKTAEKSGSRVRVDPVKDALAANWLNPEFPLWLMQNPAIASFLRMLGIEENSEEVIREFTKKRKGSPRSALYPASKRLIKSLELESGSPPRFRAMTLQKYLGTGAAFCALEAHLEKLADLLGSVTSASRGVEDEGTMSGEN